MKSISGWQRIGIVVSVLWIVGLPTYLVIYQRAIVLGPVIMFWMLGSAALIIALDWAASHISNNIPRWSVDIIRKRAEHLGEVDAPCEQAAINELT
jgi:hypothetical protein